MKTKIAGWSRRYQTALRRYLAQGSAASVQPTLGLGRQAVILGLETLDLARIHEQALMALVSPSGSLRNMQKTIARAKSFFAEAIVPIEKTHRAAQETNVQVNQLTQTLRRRTMESSAATRRLKRGVARRRAAEAVLKKSGAHRIGLLQESRRLQNRLRDQMRAMLVAQESGRQKSSSQLHDEIAQTLLAIHVRLLTLKKATKASTESLKKEIAETQRLVKQSVAMIQRLAHEYGANHEA